MPCVRVTLHNIACKKGQGGQRELHLPITRNGMVYLPHNQVGATRVFAPWFCVVVSFVLRPGLVKLLAACSFTALCLFVSVATYLAPLACVQHLKPGNMFHVRGVACVPQFYVCGPSGGKATIGLELVQGSLPSGLAPKPLSQTISINIKKVAVYFVSA